MSATAIHQTPEAIRRLSLRSVREQIRRIDWLSPADRSCLERLMTDMLPRWDAALHAERLLKFAKGERGSEDVRSAGVMVLSNMLAQLARNTTATSAAEDREAIIWEVTQKLHQLMLENVRPRGRA